MSPPTGRPLGAWVLDRSWRCPASPGRRRGRAGSKREAIKMPRRRPERKTRPFQISWACGIILIKIIDSYCTCENRKKLIPTLNPTNRLELLDGAGHGCDLGSDLVLGFPSSVCLDFFYLLFTSSWLFWDLGGAPHGGHRPLRDVISDPGLEWVYFP